MTNQTVRACGVKLPLLAVCAFGMLFATGCGPQFGAWLYTLGLYPTQTIPAQFKLPSGPVLVLVDDDRDLIQPTTAREALVDELARLLKENAQVEQVTTNEELARLRRDEPKFDQRGARELGQAAKADTVLWLATTDFSLNNDLEMVMSPARFTVAVRVIDAKAEEADKVRLWPTEREGRLVQVQVSPHEIRQCKDLKEAHQKVASVMAVEVAKLFYDQKIRE
jgi:virulence-associated protein VagC